MRRSAGDLDYKSRLPVPDKAHAPARWTVPARQFAPGFLLLAASAAFASWACFRQFGGYDLSPLIDAFWRARSGQVPGVDFINTFPLIIHLSAKLAAPLDLGWYELTLVAIVHTMAAFGAVMAMTPPEQRRASWSLVTAAVFAVPLVYTNHVWHSTSSQLAAAVFLYAVHQSLDRADVGCRDLVWVATTAAIVALAKQNVAAPVIVAALAGVLMLGGRRRWHLAAAVGLGAGVGLILALQLLGMRGQDLLASYTAVAGRGLPSQANWTAALQVRSSLSALLALGGALAVMLWHVSRYRPIDRPTAFLLLLLPVTLLPLATDWDAKLNDVALPLFLVCCWGWSKAPASAATRRPVGAIVALVLALAVMMGATRERMASVGPYAFWEPVADHQIATGYFAGMHVGARMDRVLGELDQLHHADPHGTMFFGPRLEFGYRVTGVPSPRGMPLWWHPGSSYAIADEGRVVRTFIDRRFDTLVFLGDDRTRMPQALLVYIDAHYARVPAAGELQIFRRRPIRSDIAPARPG
jgi:hypothetical protein